MKKVCLMLVVLLVLSNQGFCLPQTEKAAEPAGIEPQKVDIKGTDRSPSSIEEEEMIMKPLSRPEPPAYTLEKLMPPVIESIPAPPSQPGKEKKALLEDGSVVKPVLYSLGLSYGNQETLCYDFTHTNERPELAYSLSINRSRSDGFSQGTISNFFRLSLDELAGHAVYTFNNWSLRTNLAYFNKELTLPYSGTGSCEQNKREKSISLNYEVKVPTDSKFNLGLDIIRDSLTQDSNNTALGAHLQFITPFKPDNPPISIGTRLYQERISHQTDYTYKFNSLYFETSHLKFRKLLAGLKLSHDSYKNGFNYSQAGVLLKTFYTLKNGFSIQGNLQQELSLPVFSELYLKNDYVVINPLLEPQQALKLILKGEYQSSDTLFWGSTVFHQSTKRLIYWQQQANKLYQPANLDKASLSGVTLSLKHRLNPLLSQSVSYTFCQARNKAGGKEVPYIPANKLKIGLEYKNADNLEGDLTAEYISSRFTTTNSSEKLESYFLVNLEGEKKVSDTLFYSFSIENLLDEEYETWQGYFGQKRRLALGVRLKF